MQRPETMEIKKDSGQVTVLIALTLVVLLGLAALVVDGGLLYVTRQRLQDVADMAALAAGTVLAQRADTESVIETIEKTVSANLPGANLHVSLDTAGCGQGGSGEDVSEEGDKSGGAYEVDVHICISGPFVTVTVMRPNVGFMLAGILGQKSAGVSATATAKSGPAGGVSGKDVHVVPWGVSRDEVHTGDKIELMGCSDENNRTNRNDDNSCTPGNFGALQLDDPGGRDYREMIAWGYQGELSADQQVYTDPGRNVGDTRLGLVDLLAEPASPECAVAGLENAVFVVAPVVDGFDNGKSSVTIKGFAGLCIDKNNDNAKEVWGMFIRTVVPGELADTVDDDTNSYNFLRAVHLVPNPH